MIFYPFGIFLFLLGSLFISTSGCSSNENTVDANTDFVLNYNFKEPIGVFELDDDLNEISGLSWRNSDENLLAVTDNSSLLYILNTKGDIVTTLDLGIKDDFEGVSNDGKRAFVVNSKGKIFELPFNNPEKVKTKLVEGLSEIQEPEGLCHSLDKKNLLVAAKGHPGKGWLDFRGKAVFKVQSGSKSYDAERYFKITPEDCKPFIADVKNSKQEYAFSGIAVHPITGNIYLISAVNEWIFIAGPEGKLLHTERFDIDGFYQPEGISFDRKGNLYIASEGKDKSAILLVYQPTN